MNALQLLEEFKKSSKAVFTIKDIARIINKNKKYTSLLMLRLKKRGLILEIENGKYCLKDENILNVSTSLVFPSYISFIAALSFYRATTQIPRVIEIVSPKSKNKIKYQGYTIQFIRFNKNRIFGYKKEYAYEKNMFIAEPEKLIIDCLLLNRTSLKDVFILLKSEKIDVLKLCGYAKKMNSKILIKRLGYLLEMAQKEIYKKFLKIKFSKKYEKLNSLLPARNIRSSKWKLIINEDINAQ